MDDEGCLAVISAADQYNRRPLLRLLVSAQRGIICVLTSRSVVVYVIGALAGTRQMSIGQLGKIGS